MKGSRNRLQATFVNDLTNPRLSFVADQMIVEMGRIPMNDLFDEIRIHTGNKGVTDLNLPALVTPWRAKIYMLLSKMPRSYAPSVEALRQ